MLNSLFHTTGVNLVNNLSAALKSLVNTWTKKKKKNPKARSLKLRETAQNREGKDLNLGYLSYYMPMPFHFIKMLQK